MPQTNRRHNVSKKRGGIVTQSEAVERAVKPWSDEPAADSGLRRVRAHIGGLHCSLCTGTIEQALGGRSGVHKVAVSLTHEQALVEYDPAKVHAEDLMRTLTDIGYTLSDPRKVQPFLEQERALTRERNRFLTALLFSLGSIALIVRLESICGLGLAAFVTVSLIAFGFAVLRQLGVWRAIGGGVALAIPGGLLFALREQGKLGGLAPWLALLFAIVMIFGLGGHIFRMAAQALRRGILNQHVLVQLGAFAGLAGGVIGLVLRRPDYPTAPFFAVSVMVLTYHIFSEWLSLIVKTRSSQAVKKLLDLQPETAHLLRDTGEETVPVELVRIGDRVRIRPGERIPVDGDIMEGHSWVDESLITGEPVPIEKQFGSKVAGGSINGSGTLLVRVTAVGEQSFLQRVIRSVEDARALKPGLLHIVDRVLRVYTPTVLGIAMLAFIAWTIGPVLAGHHLNLERAVFAALSVLVMGYPCAVGISAPLSIVRGAGEAAEQGVLMRTGEAFQALRRVTTVIFDKTGTLTVGKPTVLEIETNGIDEEELLELAAGAESSSEHPLARAIVDAAYDRHLAIPKIENFQSIAGQGVKAGLLDSNGSTYRLFVGSPTFLREQGIEIRLMNESIARLERLGRTVVGVAREQRIVGLLALDDALRPDARETIDRLKSSGIGIVLLTGDNSRAAKHIAREAGIDEVYAEVLPGDKAETVRRIQNDKRTRVAMVGDGINDAPALMQADVGIAMGNGTDIAIEAADVVLLNARLTGVLTAYEISRHSYRKMLQNITLAFLFNGIGIPVAATGLIYPVWAMVAMAASVTTIFINSLQGRSGLFFGAISSVGHADAA